MFTPFAHNHFGNPADIGNNPHSNNCAYCNSPLKFADLENELWPVNDHKIRKAQVRTAADYKQFHDLEDCYLNLRMDTKEEETWIQYCAICGWWRLVKQICVCAEEWQIWDIFFGLSGVLKNFDLNDLNVPIDEISRYLIAKYEARFTINPRIFERVVADVFKGLGYHAFAGAYTNDGGVDVVLENTNGDLIGVQVKRYKNKIKVEQIRAFAGALLLAGYNKGIFVTTSDFQPGANSAAANYKPKTLGIELINSEGFYSDLKISRKPLLNSDDIVQNLISNYKGGLYDFEVHTPRNSL